MPAAQFLSAWSAASVDPVCRLSAKPELSAKLSSRPGRPFQSWRQQPQRKQRTRCRAARVPTVASSAIKEGELVSSEAEFLSKVTQHEGPIIVDWMAKWCRKCIYLKPKLEKLLQEEFPGLDLVFIDVNAIPGELVYGHGIKKMPTITIHKDGTKVREHIAAEVGLKAITNIRSMISDYMKLES